jgi:hypothetical protein
VGLPGGGSIDDRMLTVKRNARNPVKCQGGHEARPVTNGIVSDPSHGGRGGMEAQHDPVTVDRWAGLALDTALWIERDSLQTSLDHRIIPI